MKGLTGVAVAVSVPLSVTTMRIYSTVTANSQGKVASAVGVPCKLQVYHLLGTPALPCYIPSEKRATREPFGLLSIHVFWQQV